MIPSVLRRLFLRSVPSTLLTLVLLVPAPILVAQAVLSVFHLRQVREEVVGSPAAGVMAHELWLRLSEMGLLLAVGALGLVVALRISSRFCERVKRLTDHALSVGRGELGGYLDARGPAELRLLAASLNRMTDDLRDREAERERMLRAEQSARSEAEHARGEIVAILESITDAFIAADAAGRITYFNGEAERLLGSPRESALGGVIWDFHQGGLGAQLRAECAETLSQAKKAAFQVYYAPRGVWLDIHAYPRVGGFSLCIRDVTKRHRAETALARSERRLAEAERLGAMGYWEVDLATMQIGWSEEVFRLYERDPALGAPSVEDHAAYYEPEDWARLQAAMRRAADTGERKAGDYRMRLPSGATAHHFVLIEAVRDETGRVVRLDGVVQDVSERKRLEEALRSAKEAAEAANRAKSEFLANMSHEVRTPLNAVLGLADLVLRSELGEEQRRLLALAKESAESLLQVIGDILDFSKIEAGKLELEEAEFDVRDAVESALDRVAASAQRKGLELFCRISPEVPKTLLGDAVRLQQVLLNLVGNAVKFTSQGEISVRVGAPLDPALDRSKCLLRVSVRDTGVGIPRERMDRLFQSFSQVDASLTRRHIGSGLGLAICRRIVEAMGGSIGVESAPGSGSTFFFTAVLAAPPGPAERETQPAAPLQDVRLLLVEESEGLRKLLRDVLVELGAGVTGVEGARALEALDRAEAAGAPYDVVLLDRQLGGADGFVLAEAIRRRRGREAALVAMLPVHDLVTDTRRCREAGISAYVVKPVRPSELLRSVRSVVGRPVEPVATSPAEQVEPEPSSERLNILLAEDNATSQLMMQMLLAQKGWNVVTVGSGSEALDALGSEGEFDAVLMDVQMPGMDGLTATRILRDREARARSGAAQPARLPVIALTAHALKDDRERCLAAGMDDYLPKPVQADLLYAVVSKWTRLSRARRPPAESPCDLSNLLNGLRGNHTAVRRLVSTFVEELPEKLERLRSAVAAGDGDQVRSAAHGLRGGLLLFGAATCSSLASEVENLAAQNDFAGLAGLLVKLEAEAERVKEFLSTAG